MSIRSSVLFVEKEKYLNEDVFLKHFTKPFHGKKNYF